MVLTETFPRKFNFHTICPRNFEWIKLKAPTIYRTYASYTTLSDGILWNIPRVTCISSVYTLTFSSFRRVCISRKYKRQVGHSMVYLEIIQYKNTAVNTTNATCAWCIMGLLDVTLSNIYRLFSILIGCIFYGKVSNRLHFKCFAYTSRHICLAKNTNINQMCDVPIFWRDQKKAEPFKWWRWPL